MHSRRQIYLCGHRNKLFIFFRRMEQAVTFIVHTEVLNKQGKLGLFYLINV